MHGSVPCFFLLTLSSGDHGEVVLLTHSPNEETKALWDA